MRLVARLRRRRRLAWRTGLERTLAARGHELIELAAVLGEAQPLEELLELALLVFEPLQRLRAIVIEGAITARRPTEPVAAAPEAFHPAANIFHFFLQAGDLTFPAVHAGVSIIRRFISCEHRLSPVAVLSARD